MMHDKAMRAFCALSLGLVFGGFAACAGTDVPSTDDLEDDIATAYANGAGVSGGTGGSASTAGSGGRASAAGNGGDAGDDGEDPPPAGGAGGTGGGAGGSGGGEPDGEPDPSGACDGFAVLETNCAGGSCHGAGSALGNFAESEEDALSFVDADASVSCSGEGALINPADPGASVIIQKVDGTPPCGQAMPIGGTLSDDDISCLEEWIGSL